MFGEQVNSVAAHAPTGGLRYVPPGKYIAIFGFEILQDRPGGICENKDFIVKQNFSSIRFLRQCMKWTLQEGY